MGYTRSSSDWSAHPLVDALALLLPDGAAAPWHGTSRDLLAAAAPHAPAADRASVLWPKSPSAVTHWMPIVARALARRGIATTITSGTPSTIALRRVEAPAGTVAAPHPLRGSFPLGISPRAGEAGQRLGNGPGGEAVHASERAGSHDDTPSCPHGGVPAP